MSDTSGVKKTRRRAVRSEGPPPDEKETTSQVYETTVPATPAETVELDKKPVETAQPAAPEPIAESEAPAAASAGESSQGSQGFGWERIVAVAALVLAIALLVGTGFLLNLRSETSDQDALRADYVQTAKQAMLNITNISADTAAEDIKRVLEVTSGDLATEYEKSKDDYAGIVQKAQVRAKGEVIEAAIESSDDNTAIVLVAVKQTLTNAGAEGPQQRQFRFRVTIAHTEKGLAATQMEMVV